MKEKNKKNHFRVHLLRKSIGRQKEKYRQELRNLEDSEVSQKRKESLIRILSTYDKELKKINKAQRNSYIGEIEDNVGAYVKRALKKKGTEGTLFKDMIAIKHLRREFKSKNLGNPKFIVSRVTKQDKNKLKNILKGILGLDKEKEGIKEIKDKIRTVTRIISNRAIERYQGYYLESQLANMKEKDSKIKYIGYSKIEDEYRVGKKEADRIGKLTLETIKRFKEEVEEAKKEGRYEEREEEFKRRAKLIEECESARIQNKVAERYAEEVGIETWIWGPSGSKNPREEHAELYGKISRIGESPAEGGEYPGEIPNCNCEMIFINEKEINNV